MWDCKHRRAVDDFCDRRKAPCFPGGIGCVLKGFEFPFRREEDPLLKILKARKTDGPKVQKRGRGKP